MPADNVVPFLSSDNQGNDLALARRLYDTRVAISFRAHSRIANAQMPLLDRRSVNGAASFQFYMFGQTPAAEPEYQSGTELIGQDYALASGTVNCDEIIVAHKVLGDRDSIISHISMFPQFGTENGRQVALDLDRRILNQHAMAARTSALTKAGLTIHNGGIRVTRSGGSATVSTGLAAAYPKSAAGAANVRSDLRDLAALADTNFWPESDARDADTGVGTGTRWIVLDSYLKQVLQYDANAQQLFSKDYVDNGNNLAMRRIMELEGWKVLFFEKRISQGGIIPDINVTTFTKSAKFNNNFTPQTSVGYPCMMAFCARSEEEASVGFGTWQGMATSVDRKDRKHDWLAQTWCLTGIEKMRPWSAGSVELIL